MLEPTDKAEQILEAVHNGNFNCLVEKENKKLLSDHEFILAVVKKNWQALEYASIEQKNDQEIVLAAIRQDNQYGWNALRFASAGLKGNKAVVLEAVKQNRMILDVVSESLRDDREFILEAVKIHGSIIQFASDRLKGDPEVMQAATKSFGPALQHVPKARGFWPGLFFSGHYRVAALEAVNQDGNALEYAPKHLKDDREVVLAAVKQNGEALCYATSIIKGDREVVLAAVMQIISSIDGLDERHMQNALRLLNRVLQPLLTKEEALDVFFVCLWSMQ